METPIELFRYLPFRRFEEMIHSKTISASNPACWPDEYELYWKHKLNSTKGKQQLSNYLRGIVPNKDTEWYEETSFVVLKLLYERMCAICFSNKGDHVVMWEANSDNKHSVMIKTSPDKLLKLKESNDFDLILKKIRYVDAEDYSVEYFLNKIHIPVDRGISIEDIEELFLIKRKEYRYENEVRLLVKQMDLNDIQKRVALIIPDLSSFIEGVMVHPLAENYHVETVKILCDHYRIPFLGKSCVYNI